MHKRRLPLVLVGGCRGDVELDPRLVERETRQRHAILPADQAAEAAESRLDSGQAAAVALTPDEALVVRRHKLAVVEREQAIGRVDEERVVDRPRSLRLDLVDAGDEPDAQRLRGRAEARSAGDPTATAFCAIRANVSLAPTSSHLANACAQRDDG